MENTQDSKIPAEPPELPVGQHQPLNQPPKKPSNKKRVILILAIALAVLALTAGAVALFKKPTTGSDIPATSTTLTNPPPNQPPPLTPMDCSNRLDIALPAKLSNATGYLLPGQWRTNTPGTLNDYKTHGGIRFDTSYPTDVTVTAPITADLVAGSRYWQTEDKELQYLLIFQNSCGVSYRLDHLNTLSPDLQKIFDTKVAPAQGNNSLTTDIKPPVNVKKGQVIATAVGLSKGSTNPKGEVFFDFGVYDLNNKNAASKNTAFETLHRTNPYALNGLCWIDLLPAADAVVLKEKGVSAENKRSDFCTWAQ